MIIFNPDKKDTLTYSETLAPTIQIKDKAEAMQYLKDYIVYLQQHIDNSIINGKYGSVEEMAKHNIGYYAGYYSSDDRLRVEDLFECEHPYFGKAKNGLPTVDQALKMGIELGKKQRLELEKE